MENENKFEKYKGILKIAGAIVAIYLVCKGCNGCNEKQKAFEDDLAKEKKLELVTQIKDYQAGKTN